MIAVWIMYAGDVYGLSESWCGRWIHDKVMDHVIEINVRENN